MAIPSSGVYLAQQNDAEAAYQRAVAKSKAAYGQSMYSLGYNPDGTTTGDQYSQLGQLGRQTSRSIEDLNTQRDRTFRGFDTQQTQGTEDYNTSLARLGQQRGYTQQDADTSLSRLQRDYNTNLGTLNANRTSFLRDANLNRLDTLGQGATNITAARGAALARGLGTRGVGAQGVSGVHQALSRSLQGLANQRTDTLRNFDEQTNSLNTNFADSGTDVRTQLARSMAGYDNSQTDLTTNYSRMLQSLAQQRGDASTDFGRQLGDINYQSELAKVGIGNQATQLGAQLGGDLQNAMFDRNRTIFDSEQAAAQNALVNRLFGGTTGTKTPLVNPYTTGRKLRG